MWCVYTNCSGVTLSCITIFELRCTKSNRSTNGNETNKPHVENYIINYIYIRWTVRNTKKDGKGKEVKPKGGQLFDDVCLLSYRLFFSCSASFPFSSKSGSSFLGLDDIVGFHLNDEWNKKKNNSFASLSSIR